MDPQISDLVPLLYRYLRPPSSWAVDAQEVNQPLFDPPLTAPEQAVLADLRLMAKFGVEMTLAEWQSIKADAAALKAYNGVATPTLVQTAAAVKAINRVLATIVRS